jgi:hypothetical protein
MLVALFTSALVCRRCCCCRSLLAATEDYMTVAAASTLEALKWLGSRGFLE